jgi:hypothetical protein
MRWSRREAASGTWGVSRLAKRSVDSERLDLPLGVQSDRSVRLLPRKRTAASHLPHEASKLGRVQRVLETGDGREGGEGLVGKVLGIKG